MARQAEYQDILGESELVSVYDDASGQPRHSSQQVLTLNVFNIGRGPKRPIETVSRRNEILNRSYNLGCDMSRQKQER